MREQPSSVRIPVHERVAFAAKFAKNLATRVGCGCIRLTITHNRYRFRVTNYRTWRTIHIVIAKSSGRMCIIAQDRTWLVNYTLEFSRAHAFLEGTDDGRVIRWPQMVCRASA